MFHKGLSFRERQNANYLTFGSTTVLIYEFRGESFTIATPHQDKGNWIARMEFG